MKNLHDKMQHCFSESTMMLLKKVGSISKHMDYKAYLVGGTVRDLFLSKENLDIDIVIEGDAIHVERQYKNSHDSSL